MHEDGHFGDLVGHTPQPERPAPPRKQPLTAADVRAKMLELIETARGAETLPLDAPEWTKNIAMFPIMAQWLDPEDGAQLVLQFEAEIERLKRAA
jgi:predicted secreted protein